MRAKGRRKLLPAMGLAASAGVFLALIVLPVLAILDRAAAAGFLPSLPGSRTVVLQALRLSAWTSACALLVIVALGTPCAYLLARHPFRGRALVDSLIELPLVLPPTVAGIGLLMAFGRRGLLGPYLESLGITLPFTAAAVVLAQVFVAGPFYIRAARAGFEAVAPHLELVARTLGVSDWQVFWRVTVPLAAPSLLSGLTMAWARALGEFGATIMFAGSFPGRTQTMTVAIYAELERDLDGALAMAAILLGVSFALLALLRLALGRGRAVA